MTFYVSNIRDNCRIIRACRMVAKIEGRFATETLQALQKYSHLVKKISPERIRIEILKAMKLKTTSMFFSTLHLTHTLQYIFPELNACFGHTGGKYHIETLDHHMLHAGDSVSSRFPMLKLAAFLHDIGKKKSYDKVTGSFICHELYGGKIVEDRLTKLKFSKAEVDEVAQLVYCHMLQCRGLSKRGIRRLRKKLTDKGVDPRSYLRLKLADRSSNLKKDPNKFAPIRQLIVNAGIRGYKEEIPFTTHDLAISGGELINILKLTPGPVVGKLQKYLLNYVVDNGEKTNNKETLLNEANKYLKGKEC